MSNPKEVFKLIRDQLNLFYAASGFFFVIFIVLAMVSIYCIYQILNMIRFYYNQKAQFNLQKVKKTVDSNKDNYAESKSNSSSDSYDDYTRFSKNINDTISEFKSYNERLKQYYKDNKPEESPKDIIDKQILDPSSDNY
jgi:predicted PurR-regulated permease PerM